MVYDCKRIPYRIDRRLACFAGLNYDASVFLGLPFQPEGPEYGKYRFHHPAKRHFAARGIVFMRITRYVVLFIVLALSVVAVACGSGSDSEETATSTAVSEAPSSPTDAPAGKLSANNASD